MPPPAQAFDAAVAKHDAAAAALDARLLAAAEKQSRMEHEAQQRAAEASRVAVGLKEEHARAADEATAERQRLLEKLRLADAAVASAEAAVVERGRLEARCEALQQVGNPPLSTRHTSHFTHLPKPQLLYPAYTDHLTYGRWATARTPRWTRCAPRRSPRASAPPRSRRR